MWILRDFISSTDTFSIAVKFDVIIFDATIHLNCMGHVLVNSCELKDFFFVFILLKNISTLVSVLKNCVMLDHKAS